MLTRDFLETKLAQRQILLVAKTVDPISRQIVEALKIYELNKGKYRYEVLYVDQRQDVGVIDTYIHQKWLTKCRTSPHLFIRGQYVGGGIDLIKALREGELGKLLSNNCVCT